MNKQELIRETEAPAPAAGSVELMGKEWVANERNSKASAIPEGLSDQEQQIIIEDRIIEMAWEDRTPFEAIMVQFGYSEAQVIALMRRQLKRSSFNLWRKRVNSGVSIKHQKLRSEDVNRFHCSRQKSISNNKISKR
jgi:uncharacterized protein (TIGR03643 family)